MSGLKGKTVVVADDSPTIRDDIVRRYRELGMQVVGQYDTGIPVIEHLQKERPDLVSLDVIMPEMDGFEAYRIIQERYPNQKVIFVTWLASDHRIMEKLKNDFDMDMFVAKPVTSVDFQQKVAAQFGVDSPVAEAFAGQNFGVSDLGMSLDNVTSDHGSDLSSGHGSDLVPSDHGDDDTELDVPISAH